MGLEYIRIQISPLTKDNGKKTSSMEKVRRHGLMDLVLKENIFMAKNKVKESFIGMMDQVILASFILMILVDMENTTGQMGEVTTASGKIIR